MGLFTKTFNIQNGNLKKYNKNQEVVTIPNKVQVVGIYAFQDKTQVKTVLLPEGLRIIEFGAFAGCNGADADNSLRSAG